MKKTVISCLALLLVVCMASCNIIVNPSETNDGTGTGTGTEVSYPHSGMTLANLSDIIATTDNQSIPVSTFKYFFMDSYSSFISDYYYYLSYYGLNTEAPLHDQMYDADTGKTWYEYFLDSGKAAFEQYVKFAEQAIKDGMSLTADDLAEINAYLDGIESTAQSYEMTFEDYMSDYMGEGMTREVISEAVKLSQLGYKYYQKIYNEPVYTEAQVIAEYDGHLSDYALCDYYEISVSALYDASDTDEAIAAAKADATEKAEDIVNLINGGKSPAEAYNEIFPVSNNTAETTAPQASETGDTAAVTEAEAKPKTDDDLLVEGATYSSLEKYTFIYETGAKVGQLKSTTDEDGNVTIVIISKLPYKDTTKTVNVRHILLDSSKYDTEEEALAAAEALLAQINAASDKKAKFIELVPANSTDTGSSANGGLYEKVCPGDMVEAFDKWCFDTARKVGDTGIVKTDYGYHVMYFDSMGGELWYFNAETALREADFETKSDQIYASITVTYKEELLDLITE